VEEKRWLLVFDNVENFYDLRDYIPNKVGNLGSILMTTRSPLGPFFIATHAFEIQPFSKALSIKLLFSLLGRQCADDEEFDAAREMLERLGGMTLAIATIAGFISRMQLSILDCRSFLREKFSRIVFGRNWNNFPHDQTLNTVFDVSLETIPQDSVSILNVLAFLDPDSTQEEMLLAEYTKQPSDISYDRYR